MRSLKFILSAVLAASLLGGAIAQEAPLPEAAEQALSEGRAAMNEALATYERQYPDRQLWQEAFRHGRRALSLAPDHPAPLRFLATAYSRSNWYGPAWNAWLDYLDREFLLDANATPLFTEVGALQGYNYYREGRLEEAAEVYRRIIDEVPFDLEAHTWMGRLLLEMGRPEAAISYWQTVVDRNPNDARAEYFLELAREQARWGSEAVTAFREGVSFYEQGNLERARERFARATSLNGDYAQAWAWLGRVAFERDDYRDARTYYNRANRLEPDNQTYEYFFEESQRRIEAADADAADGQAENAEAADTEAAEGAREGETRSGDDADDSAAERETDAEDEARDGAADREPADEARDEGNDDTDDAAREGEARPGEDDTDDSAAEGESRPGDDAARERR